MTYIEQAQSIGIIQNHLYFKNSLEKKGYIYNKCSSAALFHFELTVSELLHEISLRFKVTLFHKLKILMLRKMLQKLLLGVEII